MPGDARFSVHAKVLAPPRLSGLPAAPENLEIAGGADLADQPLAARADLQPARSSTGSAPGPRSLTGELDARTAPDRRPGAGPDRAALSGRRAPLSFGRGRRRRC